MLETAFLLEDGEMYSPGWHVQGNLDGSGAGPYSKLTSNRLYLEYISIWIHTSAISVKLQYFFIICCCII